MDATSIKIKAVSRPSNLSRKVITPKPLNLKVSAIKLKKKVGHPTQPYSLQDENFDPRPFSFLENDPVTPGFEPITPFEITPPNSAGGTEEDHDDFDDNGSDIIDSPGPTADFHNNKIRKALGKEPENDGYEDERLRQEEAEYVARNLGFSQAQPSNYRGLVLKKSSKKPSKQSLRHRESRETMFSDDSMVSEESHPTPRHNSRFSMSTATDMDPTTPFMDTGFEDHDYFDNSKTPQANSSRNLLLRGTAPASATRTKFVSTELVMPMPQHPTPLSPTMERFLSKMSEVIASPLSATFSEDFNNAALDPATPALPTKTEFKIPSHVIDVNLVSVVAMDFGPQPMIDISGNTALVQQECDPISEPKHSNNGNTQQLMYIIPILLNDPASFCACDKAHVDSDTSSIASATRSAVHPSNILRFENVIVQMRLAPRPRIRRHGWTFLNIGIPTRIVVGILDHLEKELVSVGKCKMVLHGDYYWIYTPVRAFTKIYKREFITSPKGVEAPSRTNSKTPKTVADLESLREEDEDDDDNSVIDDSGDEEEEERQTIYKELPDSRFYSLLETRSLSVDLYTEIYAKSSAEFPIDNPAQGDFSLGFSIREIIVTAESNVRGPDWSHVKSQRTKCLARGHPIDMISPVSGINRSAVGSPFNPGAINTHAINAWNSNVTAGSVRSASNLGNLIDRWDPNATPVNRTDPNATPVARSVANGSIVNGHDYASMARYGSRGATATPSACSHCGSHVPDGVSSPLSAVATSPIVNNGRFDKRSNSSLSASYRSQSLNRIREDGRQSSRGYKPVDEIQHSRTNSRSRNDDTRSGSKVRSRSQLSRRDNKDGRQSAGRRREDRSQSRDRTIERDAASTPKAPQTTSTTYDSDNWVVKDKSNHSMEDATPEKPKKRWGRKKKYVD
ncbi:hypothetical protein TWF481_003432 [Arthrobotrys musiformis]|uniref:Uncharacterized protein n=1 Tax=Arthrobotrys musiformis TaxID=47236 RepID=A0AAV9VSB9_9PEZI